MHHRGMPVSGLTAPGAAVGCSRDHRSIDLTVWPPFGDHDGCRDASGPVPVWWAIQAYAVGELILGHDVSGTGWQTMGRAMQSITTMMPV
jgi:hypothetical protein